MTKVNNVSNYAWDKVYMVIRWCDGEWWYWGATDNDNEAMEMAQYCNGETREVADCECGQY